MEQHQREEGGGFRRGPGGHQRPDESAEANGFGRKTGPDHPLSSRGRIPFVENEVDDRQHGVESLGDLACLGDGIRNSRLADFALGPHEPLCHRGRGHEKGPGNLVRFEPAECPKRESNLRLRRQRRVATGKDQPKALVGNLAGLIVGFSHLRSKLMGELRLNLLRKQGLAPETVDRLMARGLNDPCAREFRDAGLWPLVQSGRKCFLRILFRQIEVA